MQYWTLEAIRQKVEKELDLEEETFIPEIDSYIREGIDLAETEIMGLYEDYYLTKTDWLTISDKIALPDNIYANKIRRFEVREDDENRFQIHKNNHLKNYDNRYGIAYNIYNYAGAKPVVEIEGEHQCKEYRLFYIRNANTPTLNSDLIDLPECAIHFVGAFVRARCYEKELDPRTQQAKAELEQYRIAMVESLTNIVDDGSELLEPDTSFYTEFDDYNYFY